MDRVKILYITPLRGGIGHWSRCLIEELDNLADVIIVTYKRKRKEDDVTPFMRVTDDFILEVIDPERPYHIIEYNNRSSLEELVRFTGEVKPDCVHFVMWAGRQIVWFLKDYSRMLNERSIPIVVTAHEAFPQIIKEGDIQLFSQVYTYVDHIVVLTEDALYHLRDAGVTTPISVVPHGNYHAMNKDSVNNSEARVIVGKRLSIPMSDVRYVVLFFGFIPVSYTHLTLPTKA